MGGERSDVGVVEHHGVGGRVGACEGAVQPVAQLHRHQGVHAEIEEPHGGGRRRRQPQHRLDLGLEERRKHFLARRRRRLLQLGEQVFGRACIAALVCAVRQHVLQQRRAGFERFAEGHPVAREHHAGGGVFPHQPVEGPETLLRRDPLDPARRGTPGHPLALLLGLADLRPRAPGDGLAGEPQRAPMGGELVEEGVGRRVVGLARIAQHTGDAGEEHEHVEVAVGGRPVQVPGPQHLGPEHRLEGLPRLVADGGVRQHADAVDDSCERRQSRIHPRQHGVKRGGVGHIGEFHLQGGPLPAQRLDRLSDLRVGRAAAVEHDGAGAALGEPAGDRDADAAEPTGHQIAPVLAQPAPGERRVGEDDLADVTRTLHALHRAPRLGHGPAGVKERSELAGLQPRHHPAQDFSGLCGLFLLENVDHEDGVGDVRPDRRHLVLAQDVDPAHFHEAAALREAREARLDVALAGQAVQHHVDPGAVGGREDVFAERRRAAVEHMLHAERAQIVPLACARGREHLRTGRLGKLDCREPHAAGTRVNQHPVPGVQPRKLERERRRDKRRRNRRKLGDREPRRRGHDHLFQGHRLRAVILERHSDDPVAHGNAGDVVAHLQHPAAELAAHEVVDEADGDEHVPEVEAEGLDGGADLARLQRLLRLRHHLNGVEGAAGIGLQHPAGLLRKRQPVRDAAARTSRAPWRRPKRWATWVSASG